MKKNTADNIKACVITSALVFLTCMAESLPWWSFVVPVLLFGIVTTFLGWKVTGFAVGCISGFVIWLAANIYFDMIYNSVFYKLGLLLSMPKIIVLLIAGVIGGLLTGLALHTGKSMFSGNGTN
ncbi:hypothetical protein [Chitinophaga sp. RAB17]|uniref:hypothetical protein n=1 Tax=Chitinophaga sp. RAB17 TaxID=3233049 RepID=UPI003F90FF4E